MINQEKEVRGQTQPFSNKKRKLLALAMFIFVFAIAVGLYIGKIDYPSAPTPNSNTGSAGINEPAKVGFGTETKVKYAGEMTINAKYAYSYNIGSREEGHVSAQFSAVMRFSDLTMSFYNGPLSDLGSDGSHVINSGGTKITGNYTFSCSNPSKSEKYSTSGEIIDDYYKPEYGMRIWEIFDTVGSGVKRSGLKPSPSGYLKIVTNYEAGCFPGIYDSSFHTQIINDVFNGVDGNRQRLANMELKKIGYMSYEGETIPFSGTIVKERLADFTPDPNGTGVVYTGNFKVYKMDNQK